MSELRGGDDVLEAEAAATIWTHFTKGNPFCVQFVAKALFKEAYDMSEKDAEAAFQAGGPEQRVLVAQIGRTIRKMQERGEVPELGDHEVPQ